MKPAIVLGMSRNGLGIVRSLGRQGIEVYGVDTEEGIAFSSKYCKRKYISPDPAAYPDECLNRLLKLGESLDDKAVMIATNDPYVTFMSRFRTELSQYYLFNIPEASLIENIMDKRKQYLLAKKLGIPVPKTISPRSLDELKEEDISYPAIIKGADSKSWIAAFVDNGFAATSYEELQGYLKQALEKNIEVIIQEMIIGSNKNFNGIHAHYSREKELLSIGCFQRVRQYPIDMGNGTYIVIVDNPELIALGRKFLEGMGYTGVANVQFKYDDRDGQHKLVEINPRHGMANIMLSAAGVNCPYIEYLECTGEKVTPSLNLKENTCWLNFFNDIRSFWANKKRGDITLTEWLKSVFRANCFPHFAGDDLKPACKYHASQAWRLVKRTCGFKA